MSQPLIQDDTFSFFIPVDFEKGTDENGKTVMRMRGVANSGLKDREGETLAPSGFDYSYLLTAGFINWNHQGNKNPKAAVIGQPDIAKINDEGQFYIEGFLYPDNEMAVQAYEAAEILEKNSPDRRMGWSIEGKILEKEKGNKKNIKRAKITGVALTPQPIDSHTYAEIVKAFTGEPQPVEEPDETPTHNITANGGQRTMILDETLTKGGYVRKYSDGTIEINLDKGVTSATIASVTKEALDDEVVNLPGVGEEVTKKRLTKSQAYERIFRETQGLSIADAKKIMASVQKPTTNR